MAEAENSYTFADHIEHPVEALRVIAAVNASMRAFEQGAGMDAKEALAHLRKKHGIPSI